MVNKISRFFSLTYTAKQPRFFPLSVGHIVVKLIHIINLIEIVLLLKAYTIFLPHNTSSDMPYLLPVSSANPD